MLSLWSLSFSLLLLPFRIDFSSFLDALSICVDTRISCIRCLRRSSAVCDPLTFPLLLVLLLVPCSRPTEEEFGSKFSETTVVTIIGRSLGCLNVDDGIC